MKLREWLWVHTKACCDSGAPESGFGILEGRILGAGEPLLGGRGPMETVS